MLPKFGRTLALQLFITSDSDKSVMKNSLWFLNYFTSHRGIVFQMREFRTITPTLLQIRVPDTTAPSHNFMQKPTIHRTKLTYAVISGDKLSIWSTTAKFVSPRGAKKNVSPSSSCIRDENSGSSSSSPRCAIWYKWLKIYDENHSQFHFSLYQYFPG